MENPSNDNKPKKKKLKLRDTINLDDKEYWNMNIGGVIIEYLDETKSKWFDSIFLQMCNEFGHGSFTVPCALGFSTPINPICKGGELIFCDSSASNINERGEFIPFDTIDKPPPLVDIYKVLDDWEESFGGVPRREPAVHKFTSNDVECSICIEDYNLGCEIETLLCGHKFHQSCICKLIGNKINGQKTTILDVLTTKTLFGKLPTINCPLCARENE